MKYLAFISLVFIIASCKTVDLTYDQVRNKAHTHYQESLRQSFISEFYYIGSDSKYDYFEVLIPPYKTKSYRSLKSTGSIPDRFRYKSSKRLIPNHLTYDPKRK